jgi:catechol 2,3-dioxygenase-like lactoylglutathione lyase family enzyme
MIHHVSIGTRDIARARKFYDATMAPLGYKCLVEGDEYLGYGDNSAAFWVLKVPNPVPANDGSGLHFCLVAKSRKAVDSFHAAALRAGGSDNGKPGLRKDYGDNYYAAFVVDPDGYRLEAYTDRSE